MSDLFTLSGKVALVVGGRGYLGQRFCTVMTQAGATVFSADLPKQSLAAKKAGKGTEPPAITQKNVDVTDASSVSTLVADIVAETGRLDVLVYAATAKAKDFFAPFTECSLEGWKRVLAAELDGAFLVAQATGKIMEKQKKGSIIFLSSIYGIVGNDQRIYEDSNLASLYADDDQRKGEIVSHGAYNTAKGGIIAFTRYLAAYWGHIGIRVNCISPGGMWHPGESEDFVRKYSLKVPMGRKGKTEELDGALLYLASDASSYVTGHNLIVDGGWTAW
ncbi:hypothetical protein A3C37_04620 [Candidatus Peribacteria bacterium RIFCSPHIGHO2_02_FULL_53_20]|nr:MAG: hypothetical protein A3C37_04620 [Candidatus Peribacteria bacterium RIFCSPHIGHO2_02_FULL_53_20]OGJ69912.1 MAG: hypothetical protein A3G69_02480 [Candidatus Peribacteria bacterium RIFCSPLOWO2_12_FULL_53_10]